MQTNSKIICKKISEEQGIEYDLIKSINDQLFRKVEKEIKSGKYLNIVIKGFCIFRVRRKKTLSVKANIAKYETIHEQKYLDFIDRVLSLYEKYCNYRYEVKVKKFGKESHEAFLLAQKEKQKEDNSRRNS